MPPRSVYIVKPELPKELKKASNIISEMNCGPGGTILVELRLYHTPPTRLIVNQWLPLCPMNACSFVMSEPFTSYAIMLTSSYYAPIDFMAALST